jgi:hypothetical protein
MDPNDIVRLAPEIAKGTAALGAAIPFTGIVKRMLGPASDEVAEMWRDQVRIYRYGRQLKLLEKAERMADEAGFTPHAVPPKILFPLLEGASFEDNEDLHTMWAALLANAASPNEQNVRPAFIGTLRQMSPDEALVLRYMRSCEFDMAPFVVILEEYRRLFPKEAQNPQSSPHGNEDRLYRSVNACLNSLEAAKTVSLHSVSGESYLQLTPFGVTFLEACEAPKPNS